MTGVGDFCPAHPGSRTSYSRCVCGERAGPELCARTLVHRGSTSGPSSNLTTQRILPPNAVPLGAGCPPENSGGTQTFCGHTWERGPQGQTPTLATLRPLLPPPWKQAVGLGGLLTPKKSTILLTWSCSALYKYTLIWILFMSCGEGIWSRLPWGGAASCLGWALGEGPGSGTQGTMLGANPRGSVWWVNVGAAIGCAWAVRPTLGAEPAAPDRRVPAVGNWALAGSAVPP